jgi:hypothetical protein
MNARLTRIHSARMLCAALAIQGAMGGAMGGVMVAAAGTAYACPPIDAQTSVKDTGAAEARRPVVRIALLLDTSNSMDGLINQAKAQLWSIVNRFGRSCRDGARPELRIALYEYGNTNLKPSDGYVRQVLPFTTDLDLISEKLFSLTTRGGDEYCGAVIQRAVRDLSWDKAPGDLSILVIAGNEPFTQGDVHYSEAIADAVNKGVRINTIFCGDRSEGVATKWADGATLGRGTFGNIDQGAPVDHTPSPFDDEIVQLGAAVNDTYVPMGRAGVVAAERQESMDRSARALPAAAGAAASVERAAAKNTAQYTNSQWDLVDAVKEGKVKLADAKDADLPEELRSKTLAEREAFVQEKLARRTEINQRVQELQRQRHAFLEEQKRAQPSAAPTLADALLAAIDQQAKDEGYEFEK